MLVLFLIPNLERLVLGQTDGRYAALSSLFVFLDSSKTNEKARSNAITKRYAALSSMTYLRCLSKKRDSTTDAAYAVGRKRSKKRDFNVIRRIVFAVCIGKNSEDNAAYRPNEELLFGGSKYLYQIKIETWPI